MKFEVFKPVKNFNYSSGWDKFALDYAQLPHTNGVYSLTKELIYTIIEKNVRLSRAAHILDIGCGTGNDFPFFLSRGVKVTAFDKSAGMLNKAAESYPEAIQSGQLTLLRGDLENFDGASLENAPYDLIFSVTGGFSYINDRLMLNVFESLRSILKPGGKIITGHFNSFCLMECLYYILRLQLKSASRRTKDTLQVEIKNETMTMHFRTLNTLKALFTGQFGMPHFYPLLAATAPYQTGYTPGKKILALHRKTEHTLLNFTSPAKIADQIIMVLKNE